MGKKAVILCMSCNQDRYINEESVIKRTWGKDILDGKYPDISLYFYRGGADEISYDEENCTVYTDTNDDLNATFHKTLRMLQWCEENVGDFDYIIRTNTSTYLNIEGISQFLNMENIKDDVLYGKGLIINSSNYYIPFLRGCFLIIPKSFIKILYKHSHIYGVDDSAIGMALYANFREKYLEEHIREIDAIVNIKEEYYNNMSKALFIRLKDEDNPENNITKMMDIHTLYQNIKDDIKISTPHCFTHIETLYGMIPI